MDQIAKAEVFKSLHVPGSPVLLFNIWDAGGARALSDAGAAAIATGSYSVAAAQGYADAEGIPLDFMLQLVGRITGVSDVPVTVDFEGGYATAPEAVADNVARLKETGAVGLNFEDRVIGGEGLHPIAAQAARIAAIRARADEMGVPLVINARTDVFFTGTPASEHPGLLGAALERAAAYAEAGADCFFVPGLGDPEVIGRLCTEGPLPVNVMMAGSPHAPADMAQLGVARLSYGPGPYFQMMKRLVEGFGKVQGALGR